MTQHPKARSKVHLAIPAGLFTLCVLLAGCGASGSRPLVALPPAPDASPATTRSEPRLPPGDISLFGIAGRTLWIPLAPPANLPPGTPWTPNIAAQPLLDGKEPLGAELLGLVGQLDPTARLRAPATWQPQPTLWNPVSPADVLSGAAPPGQALAWALAVELPSTLADRRAITIDLGGRLDTAKRVVVRILPAPTLGLDTRRLTTPDAPPEAWRALGERLRTEAVDPFRRWRIWLAMDRFDESRLFGPGGFPSHDPMRDPVLRRISSMIEERWRIAINELVLADESVAAALVMRLTAIARAPSGELLPVWSLDATDEYDLLERLLDPRLRPEQRVARAQEWLDEQPTIMAWVIDDAGYTFTQREAPEGPELPAHMVIDGARIGVMELAGQATTATLGPATGTPADRQQRGSLALLPLRSASANTLAVSTDGSGAAPVLVRAQAASVTVPVVAAPMIARPPGLALGPLREGASLALLPADRAMAPPPDWATAAMLHQTPTGQWQLYVEARRPQGAAQLANANDDTVRIYLGPMSATSNVLTVRPNSGTRVAEETVWSALVDIPPGAVRTGELLIGITRADPRGALQAWPRPLLPGDVEPGRMRIDLTRWGGFEGDFEGL
ncbi:MAG: hypothetical protein KDA20_07875 [Phycisphaerales bacterium]|nr:hypothetical protein [Phycisphaerales bacterium]